MRKRLITHQATNSVEAYPDWLALEEVASVEVTSEAKGFPVEAALSSDGEPGWKADTPDPQTIRLLFDHPQTIRAIRLVFREDNSARTQEFVLRWLPAGAADWKDVVRQQWNFSQPHAALECEEYKVDLASAAALELTINPDISRPGARASLERLQLSVHQGINPSRTSSWKILLSTQPSRLLEPHSKRSGTC